MEVETQVNFEEFYAEWIDEQKQELHRLIVATETSLQPQSDSSSLSVLVTRTVAHYEKYYTVKSQCAKSEALLLLSPPWTTQLEDAFIWVGGWRPSAAFHLLLSKSGLQLEAKLAAAVATATAAPLDLGDLSGEQLRLIDELQRSTVAAERRISEKVAKQQEKVADSEMVELSHYATDSSLSEALDNIGGRVESAVKSREEGFQKVLQSADELRLATLKAVTAILTPIQAIHFLIAAAELHLRLHEWGREKEEREAYQRTPCNAPTTTTACTAGQLSTR